MNLATMKKDYYLVMYDTIPGGTGYLSTLYNTEEFSKLLQYAYDKFTIVNANMKVKTVAIIVFLHTETNTIESCSAENRLKLCLKNS